MAAYAALTSLKHIIHNLQNHPSPPISIDEQQVRSLTEVVTFLQGFLEGYNSHLAYTEEADPLEIGIADAAYAAEAVIESNIVDQIHIHIRSTIIGKIIGVLKNPGDELYRDLQLVIQEMDLIKNAAMMIQRDNSEVRPQLRRHVSTAVGPSMSSSSSSTPSSMVGFDDVFLQVLESLTGSAIGLQIIPITGMGGIGKTTLARNLFENAFVKEKFDVRAWTTISQYYNAEQTFKELLNQAKGNSDGKSEDELGLELYQHLSGRRYLIVMDDMWSIEVWDNIRRYFPNNNDGSRVLATTRLSNLASHFNNGFNMKFLDEVSSWNLFSKTVFGEERFPIELEEIGKRIARNCRGLPLSIVTIGGLLKKSEQRLEYWEHMEENLNSIVNSDDHKYCLRILKMSYNNLPVHLKSCFLYMSVFREDSEIRVSRLVKLWVSEGVLQPTAAEENLTLEAVGEKNLKNLIERNLIQVHELGSTGNIKYCKLHDLLRDMCLREAKKEGFYEKEDFYPDSLGDIYSWRRVVIQRSASNAKVLEVLRSMPHARSFFCDDFVKDRRGRRRSLSHWLLWKLKASFSPPSLKAVLQLYNLRHIALEFHLDFWIIHNPMSQFPPYSLNLLWNLETLNVSYLKSVTAPVEIWNMPLLRHVKFHRHVFLPEPPVGNVVIMENLQTLKTLEYPRLSEEVVRRIPNVKKLAIAFGEMEGLIVGEGYDYCLDKLERLNKLESFRCSLADLGISEGHRFIKKLNFSYSLRKLVLFFNSRIELEELLTKIGSLPLLQKLHLSSGRFTTGEWATVEGQFPQLEFLTLQHCHRLERWTTDRSHFPLLKEIYLEHLEELEEIPLEIGEIPTLRAIVLKRCSESAVASAKRIVEEQEELQGEEQLSFHVRVYGDPRKRGLQRFAGPNFQVSFNSHRLKY